MLIDSHIHIALNGIDISHTKEMDNRETKVAWIRKVLRGYKEKGIYMLRDGGDAFGFSAIAREIAQEEGMIYRTPVYGLYKKGYYGNFIGKPVMGLEDFQTEFQELMTQKPDHLKILLTGLVSFEQYGKIGATAFTKKELSYMTAAAHEQGIPVMVHANGTEGVQRAIDAGVDTLEHGYFMTERELQGLAEKDILWIPTLAPLGNLVDKQDNRFLKELPIIEKTYLHHQNLIRRGLDIGVKIALGSDAGAYAVPHGTGIFDEMNHMIKAGVGKEKVRNIAYTNGLKALAICPEEIGNLLSENKNFFHDVCGIFWEGK